MLFEKLANDKTVKVIEDQLRKHLTNTYFKEIQVPNIIEAKPLKKEREKLVKKIYNSFWKTICKELKYVYHEKHKDIQIKSKDVDDIICLAATFYLEDGLLNELRDFKMKNDKVRLVKIYKENGSYKEEFQKYLKNIL
ncbi:hypothetical protein P8V03_15085 [Clostridium sp. A1-XYC3]|uniref:Uncharacterized protein n=1 Tax=Clostridium tanneri TaxID=3037988 RepID=A0ABU4JWE3_9CLOT|nr:hypothetical protein [Clostridium sp. A1-XYC3]MDW8802472.1 hypothetical protein [Clostridium sp. A1-XYC3]